MSIYNAVKVFFCALGKCEYVCKVTSGVIQGCPLSGTLFVLATQPILAHLHEVIDASGKGVTRACADDIGCCYKSLWHLQCVYPVSAAAERAANLVLNIKKGVI
eukprot:3537986-Karenia_brevis.AAC.1